MKIRLVDHGYESLTGFFGDVEFKDGVSIGEVSDVKARFFAAITSVVDASDGSDPGDNAKFQHSLELKAVSSNLPTLAEIQEQNSGNAIEPEVVAAPDVYTRQSLEAIADERGIAGLREICDKLGIKGTSIAGLIDGVIASQNKPQANPAPLASGEVEE